MVLQAQHPPDSPPSSPMPSPLSSPAVSEPGAGGRDSLVFHRPVRVRGSLNKVVRLLPEPEPEPRRRRNAVPQVATRQGRRRGTPSPSPDARAGDSVLERVAALPARGTPRPAAASPGAADRRPAAAAAAQELALVPGGGSGSGASQRRALLPALPARPRTALPEPEPEPESEPQAAAAPMFSAEEIELIQQLRGRLGGLLEEDQATRRLRDDSTLHRFLTARQGSVDAAVRPPASSFSPLPTTPNPLVVVFSPSARPQNRRGL